MTSTVKECAGRLREILERSQTFLLSGHVNIDGDSLGSMLGMYYFLKRKGKSVRALAFEPLAERYAFLGGDAIVEIFDPEVHAKPAQESDVFMMFDFSNPGRMPGLWDLVKQGKAFKICVDHHQVDQLPGDLNLHDPSSPATGKIVLDLIRALGGEIDRPLAEALLVAISTDTGWFRYSNTTPEVLRDGAKLLETGIDASKVYREIYQRNDVSLIRLMGRVAADLHAELDAQLLWSTIPYRLVQELGVGQFETDELLDLMRTGRKAECVALFREMEDGQVRVNLRSRGKVDMQAVARAIGGGGHRHAAGATVSGPLDQAAERVVVLLRKALASVVAQAPPAPAPASSRMT